jgi:ribonuclease HII
MRPGVAACSVRSSRPPWCFTPTVPSAASTTASSLRTPEQRESTAARIRDRAQSWAVASADNLEIDRFNIYHASRLAMRRALDKISPPPDYLLVDALKLDTLIPQQAVIHGDALSRSIAAASILAKVERDASMTEWDQRYPAFGFLRHKGYSTPEHLRALVEHGPTPHHRYTYEPVRLAAGPSPQLTLFAEMEAACP